MKSKLIRYKKQLSALLVSEYFQHYSWTSRTFANYNTGQISVRKETGVTSATGVEEEDISRRTVNALVLLLPLEEEIPALLIAEIEETGDMIDVMTTVDQTGINIEDLGTMKEEITMDVTIGETTIDKTGETKEEAIGTEETIEAMIGEIMIEETTTLEEIIEIGMRERKRIEVEETMKGNLGESLIEKCHLGMYLLRGIQ